METQFPPEAIMMLAQIQTLLVKTLQMQVVAVLF